jgi:FkbM family methyltransferase
MNLIERIRYFASTFVKWWRVLGGRSTLQLALFRSCWRLGVRGPKRWRAFPRSLRHELTVRLRGTTDLRVFSLIFVRQEYSSLLSLKRVSLVLDLGANVGYSSVYFLNAFPESRVVAVEPDQRNVEVCEINLKPYGDRALLLHGAVWSERTKLAISRGTYGDGREWATEVVQPPAGKGGDVQTWSVGDLIDMTGCTEVDLLKVDIEGSERVVFGDTAKSWLPRVRNLCIELHGTDCQNTFFDALANFDYELDSAWHKIGCMTERNPCVT